LILYRDHLLFVADEECTSKEQSFTFMETVTKNDEPQAMVRPPVTDEAAVEKCLSTYNSCNIYFYGFDVDSIVP